ncbi:MAG: hypothetical protein U0792_11775 [Gemmataceae bacterium]
MLDLLRQEFTAADVEFYVGQDGRGVSSMADPTTADDPRSPGGLTDWLELVGHVEQELTVGTLAAARAALTARTREMLHDLIRGGTDRDSVPQQRLYLALHGRAERRGLDAAIDEITGRRAAGEAFWADFRERVTSAIRQEFRVPHVVPLAAAHTPIIAPILGSYVTYAEKALDTGRWIATPPAGLCVFRQDGTSWTVIYEGKVVGRPDAVGLFYLRLLLERPGREFEAVELSQLRMLWHRCHKDAKNVDREFAETTPADDMGVFADVKAMSDYEARAEQLIAKMRAAENIINRATGLTNDLAAEKAQTRADRDQWQEELRQLNEHITRARRLGGKPRRMGDEKKKARDAVVKAINEAVEGFSKSLPSLYDHLIDKLCVGSTCLYKSPSGVNWTFV